MRKAELLFTSSLLLTACATQQPHPRHSGLFDTGEPALHAVSDARLRELMNRMNGLVFERFVAEPDRDRETQRDNREIAQAAEDLGQSIDGLYAHLPALGLSAHEQAAFRALADKLRGQADHLRELAANGDTDELAGAFAQVNATCTACHGLFRQFGKGDGDGS